LEVSKQLILTEGNMTLDFSQVADSKAKPKKEKSKSLAIVPKLDIKKAQAQFADYSKAIDGVVEEAQALQVIDDPSNKIAVTIGTQAKKLYNEIEKKRKEITEDPNTFVKSVNNFARDEFEIEMCEDCLEKATDEAYDKGVEDGKEV